MKQAADAAGKVATAVAVGGKQIVKHASKGMIENAVSPLKRATPLHNEKLNAVAASQAKGPDAKAALAAAEKTFAANSKAQTMTNLKSVESTVGKANSVLGKVGWISGALSFLSGAAESVAHADSKATPATKVTAAIVGGLKKADDAAVTTVAGAGGAFAGGISGLGVGTIVAAPTVSIYASNKASKWYKNNDKNKQFDALVESSRPYVQKGVEDVLSNGLGTQTLKRVAPGKAGLIQLGVHAVADWLSDDKKGDAAKLINSGVK